jgi:hypothetical protein
LERDLLKMRRLRASPLPPRGPNRRAFEGIFSHLMAFLDGFRRDKMLFHETQRLGRIDEAPKTPSAWVSARGPQFGFLPQKRWFRAARLGAAASWRCRLERPIATHAPAIRVFCWWEHADARRGDRA